MNRTSSGVLFLLSASVGVAMIGLGIIWPLIPIYAKELGAGGFLVGIIIASFNIARVVFSPFSGRFSDKWGRKKFIVAGLFAYSVISVFYVLPTQAEARSPGTGRSRVLLTFPSTMTDFSIIP